MTANPYRVQAPWVLAIVPGTTLYVRRPLHEMRGVPRILCLRGLDFGLE